MCLVFVDVCEKAPCAQEKNSKVYLTIFIDLSHGPERSEERQVLLCILKQCLFFMFIIVCRNQLSLPNIYLLCNFLFFLYIKNVNSVCKCPGFGFVVKHLA